MSMLSKAKIHNVIADMFKFKYVIAGRPKTGKSSLVYHVTKEKFDGDLSKTLLIAFEKGYNALNGIHAVDIDEWEQFQELVDELVESRDEVTYRMLAFDTVDIMTKMAEKYVLKKLSVRDKKRYQSLNDVAYGRAHEMLDNEILEQITKLDKAGYNPFYITHDKDKKFKTKDGLEYDKTVLSLSGRVRDTILNSADFIIFIEITKELENGKMVDKRHIHFRGDASLEAGSRFANMPEKIEYDPVEFINAIEGAILSEYGGNENEVKKAKEKQEIEFEKQAQKFIQSQKATLTLPEAKEEIKLAIASLTNKAQRLHIKGVLEEHIGTFDYESTDDVEALNKAVLLIKEYAEAQQ